MKNEFSFRITVPVNEKIFLERGNVGCKNLRHEILILLIMQESSFFNEYMKRLSDEELIELCKQIFTTATQTPETPLINVFFKFVGDLSDRGMIVTHTLPGYQ
jgi:hypothetical protein